MKILYHHRTLGDGAEGIHISEMINAFRLLGHDVKVVSPIGDKTNVINSRISLLRRLKLLMPHIIYEFAEIGYNVYGYFALSKVIKNDRPDFIYDRYITFNASSILAGKRYNIPVILEVNAPLALERKNEEDEKLYLHGIAHMFERWICSHADKTVVVSTPLKDYLKSVGVPETNLVVMPNGVNLDTFYPREKDEDLMLSLGLPYESLVFGFVGILRPWHGLELLLKAFYEVSVKLHGSFLLIVGDGPIRQSLEDKIKELGLQDKIIITGLVDHVRIPDYINVMDVAVSPKATYYASPMKIVEYMALEKAVIAPSSENIMDIIKDNEDGLLFKDSDYMDLSLCMIKLGEDSELKKKLGVNAKKKTTVTRNWKSNAIVVIGLVQDLLNK